MYKTNILHKINILIKISEMKIFLNKIETFKDLNNVEINHLPLRIIVCISPLKIVAVNKQKF